MSFRNRFFIAALSVFLGTQHYVSAQTPEPIALGMYYFSNNRLAPSDNYALKDLERKAGRMPAVFMIYQNWTGSYSPFPWREARGAKAQGKPLMVSWEPWSFADNDPRWSLNSITGGAYDNYLREYAREARKFHAPILIRLAHEMNGDWYPWATAKVGPGRRHNNNSPSAYVAMWRHVVGIFREEGASNVAWVWSPNVFYINDENSQASQIQDFSALYPGDEWVDWVGLDIYNDGVRRTWRSFGSLFQDAYSTLSRVCTKPMMIAEIGVTEEGAPQGTSKADWIARTLTQEIPNKYPLVKMVVWFCRDKTACGEANYRFDSSPQSLAAFRSAVNSPLYSAQVTLKPVGSRQMFARAN